MAFLPFCALLLLFLAHPIAAFYLPGVAPQDFEEVYFLMLYPFYLVIFRWRVEVFFVVV